MTDCGYPFPKSPTVREEAPATVWVVGTGRARMLIKKHRRMGEVRTKEVSEQGSHAGKGAPWNREASRNRGKRGGSRLSRATWTFTLGRSLSLLLTFQHTEPGHSVSGVQAIKQQNTGYWVGGGEAPKAMATVPNVPLAKADSIKDQHSPPPHPSLGYVANGDVSSSRHSDNLRTLRQSVPL